MASWDTTAPPRDAEALEQWRKQANAPDMEEPKHTEVKRPRVSYRVEFALGAAVVFHTLPPEGQDALIARAVELVEQPWDDVVIRRPGNDAAFRETTFGTGVGCARSRSMRKPKWYGSSRWFGSPDMPLVSCSEYPSKRLS